MKHGHTRGKNGNSRGSKEYFVWKEMRQRCQRASHPRYKDYGGRGIKVCERWIEFSNFLVDMGPKPDGFSLERLNNDGNYEPSNCKWVIAGNQAKNTRRNRWITFGDKTQILQDWARDLGISQSLLHWRIKNWGMDRALGGIQ